MNAVKGIENKKWDFSKQEEAAVSWLLERGFEVKLEKQYTSRMSILSQKMAFQMNLPSRVGRRI